MSTIIIMYTCKYTCTCFNIHIGINATITTSSVLAVVNVTVGHNSSLNWNIVTLLNDDLLIIYQYQWLGYNRCLRYVMLQTLQTTTIFIRDLILITTQWYMFWCLLSTIVHSLEMWFQRTVIRLKVKDNDYIMVYRMNLNYLSIFFSTDTNPYNAQVYAWFNINVFCYKTLCKIHFLHLWQRENMLSIFFLCFPLCL